MAPPTSGHQDRVTPVTQTAVWSRVKEVFQPPIMGFMQRDGTHRYLLPD
jgi:hypothetical protein